MRKMISLNERQAGELNKLRDYLEERVPGVNMTAGDIVMYAIEVANRFHTAGNEVRKGGRAYFDKTGGFVLEPAEVVAKKAKKKGEDA